MKIHSLAILIFLLSGLVSAPAVVGAATPAQPNILVILADDLGYGDVGFQGCKDIPTPNLDRLAGEGVRFSSGYVNWMACAPSRASLITGRDSHRCGFYDNPTPVLASNQGLPPGIPTVPGVLKKQGYLTGGIGKWHLGSTPDRHPLRMGFSQWFGFLGGAHDYFPWKHYRKPLPKRPWPEWFVNQTMPILRDETPVELPADSYLTDVFTEEAVGFIQRNRQVPFFLYLAYTAPHSPWEAPEEEEQKYSLESLNPPPGVTAKQRRTYAAMVSRLDQGVGKVLQALQSNGLDERTLVFFLSDNGGGNKYPSSNAPLRGFKGDLFEGGIRVPFLARWKGRLPAGVTVDDPVSALDIGATAIALAGATPGDLKPEGVNLIPRLTGQTNEPPHERLFWKRFSRGAIREGRFKLHTNEGGRELALYDLESDLGEARNLAKEKPELAQRLHELWKAWNAEMPPPTWKMPPEREWTKPEYQPPLLPEENAHK